MTPKSEGMAIKLVIPQILQRRLQARPFQEARLAVEPQGPVKEQWLGFDPVLCEVAAVARGVIPGVNARSIRGLSESVHLRAALSRLASSQSTSPRVTFRPDSAQVSGDAVAPFAVVFEESFWAGASTARTASKPRTATMLCSMVDVFLETINPEIEKIGKL